MVRRHISNDVKELALAMSLQGIRDSEVRQVTGVSEHSLKRLRSTHRKVGAASVEETSPGPQMLTSAEVQVCHIFKTNYDSIFTPS
jgi:transposase-like protein